MTITHISQLEIEMRGAILTATQVIEEYNSPASKRAYEGDLAYIAKWYKANGLSNSEVLKEHIIMFIIQHAQDMPLIVDEYLVKIGAKSKLGPHKMATIKRRIASLSRYLNLSKRPNPCGDKDILILLRKLTEKFGCSKPHGRAITLDILDRLLNTCRNDLLGIRDRALLLFAFASGGRRISEVSSAVMENLVKTGDGNYYYNLNVSKTNRDAKEDFKPIVGRAALAMTHWVEASGIAEGALFRAIGKFGTKVREYGITTNQIRRMLEIRCFRAGLNPDLYTPHSLRSGFVTEGGRRGKHIGDLMALTGHRNVASLMQYYHKGSIFNNSAAYLAG